MTYDWKVDASNFDPGAEARAIKRIRNLKPIVENGEEWLTRADILEIIREELGDD